MVGVVNILFPYHHDLIHHIASCAVFTDLITVKSAQDDLKTERNCLIFSEPQPMLVLCTSTAIMDVLCLLLDYVKTKKKTKQKQNNVCSVFADGRSFRSLLSCLCDVFRAPNNSLVCGFYASTLDRVLFQSYEFNT